MDRQHLSNQDTHPVKSGINPYPIIRASAFFLKKNNWMYPKRNQCLTFSVLDPHHPKIHDALQELVTAVTHCKFEATDSMSDEAVLGIILKLISVIVSSEAGLKCLSDHAICEMIQVAFGMVFQGRISGELGLSPENLKSQVH